METQLKSNVVYLTICDQYVIDSSMRPFVHQRTANLPAPLCHQVDNLVHCKNKDECDRYKIFQGCIAFCNLIEASCLFILH